MVISTAAPGQIGVRDSDELIGDERLRDLLAYWRKKKAARAMPSRQDIDPACCPTPF
ncbi:MAG: PAS domain-containing protein [Alphaproteobacteria bacterium]|nr:PAS domain-containing protein [Alphaproteobacteria bacterium]